MIRNRSSSVGGRLNASSVQGMRKRSSSLSRLSQSSSFVRRASFVEPDKRVKDTRPLADKSYQSKCIRKLMEFLMENGYPHPLSQKMLVSPYSKDVFRIFEFIYSSFNPSFKISKKPEEEILRILKTLQYPFLLPKSTLQNAGGSRHAWSSVLGMLTWLVEFSQYCNAGCQEFDRASSKFSKMHERLAKSFAHFVETGLDDDEDEEEKWIEEIVELDEAREKHDQVQENYDQAEKQLQELHLEERLLHEDEDRHRLVSTDVESLKDYFSGMEERISTKKEELVKMTSELERLGTILNAEKAEVEQLKEKCQEQNLKGENMHQVQTRKQELVEKLGREAEQLTHLKRHIRDLEPLLLRQKSKVDDSCQMFNNSYRALRTLVAHKGYPLPEFEARVPGCSRMELEQINDRLLSLSKRFKDETTTIENKLIKHEEYIQELQLQLRMSTQELEDKTNQMEKEKRDFEDRKAKTKGKLDQVEAHDEAISQSTDKMLKFLGVTPEQRQLKNNKLRQQLEELTAKKTEREDEAIKILTEEAQKAKDIVAALEKEEEEFIEYMKIYIRSLED